MPNWKKVIVSGSSAHLNQITGSGGIKLADDAVLNIGDGNDLQLYHDGSNSYIKDNGTGNLNYMGGTQTFQNAAGSKTMMVLNSANSVDLNYNNSTKFQTTNTGVDVTGIIQASGNISGSSSSTGSFGSLVVSDKVQGTTTFGGPIRGEADSYTKLLIHSDHANGSTDIVDSSPSKHSITVQGNAHHTSSIAKFGNTGMHFDGTDDYLTLADSTDWAFGAGNFTIDLWIYQTAGASNDTIIGKTNGTLDFDLYTGTDPYYNFRFGANGATNVTINSGEAFVAGWHHIAIVRDVNDLYFFLDGVKKATGDVTGLTLESTGNDLDIMALNSSFEVTGLLDEFRISKGIARWSTDFAPPTRAYATIDEQFYTEQDKLNAAIQFPVSGSSSNAHTHSTGSFGRVNVAGNIVTTGNISGSSTSHLTMAQISSSGDVVADGDVIAYNSSDIRLKDNIEVIKGSLDKIDGIRGVEFDWNDKSPGWAQERGHDIGVIAQEVQKVVPEIVVERKNGYLGVDYKRLVPLLIESVKELRQEVEDLKKKVN